jgi:hypothetical protein
MKHQDPNEKEGTEETVTPPAEVTTAKAFVTALASPFVQQEKAVA